MLARVLSCETTHVLAGCRLDALHQFPFGGLVKTGRSPLGQASATVYGLVAEITVPETAAARELALQDQLPQTGLLRNELSTAEPPEMRILVVGYRRGGQVSHLLPPQLPQPLTEIEPCSPEEVADFTGQGRLGYLRHILRFREPWMPELLAAHLQQAAEAHKQAGHDQWLHQAVQRVIRLLQDDPPTLLWVLDALSDALPIALA